MEHVFTKVRIPGEEQVDLAAVIDPAPALAPEKLFAE
jgi:hypothetical protein